MILEPTEKNKYKYLEWIKENKQNGENMKEIDYINVIEKLNEDYNSKINDVLNSKSYRLGNKICLLFDIK